MNDTQEPKRFRVEPTYSVTSSLLIDRLKDGHDGDIITDDELFSIAGASTAPGQKGYSSLQSAIRFCRRRGLVWQRVRGGRCIKCFDATEKLALSNTIRRSITRRSRLGVTVLGSIERDKLTKDQQREYDARTAQFATMAMFSESATTRKLEEKQVSKGVDRASVLALFAQPSDQT